ncbi:protein kinase domain-containing protein [Pendulispora albinea]|uniref:Tetratricopeptide repeat protein n=1 Tax=Pendulispora albinea TaxID=2741071 RepID=A0ABZ2M759_9BACT
MGCVYQAYDPKLNRNVAIKLIGDLSRFAADPTLRPRLLREAQALAQVVHPHVVSVFDVGEFREHMFFAMELIEGTTLRDELARGRHDLRTMLQWLDQAGRGLAAAHRAGLVHRDFKPDNVLIDRERRAKVVDFGLARAVDALRHDPVATAMLEEHATMWNRRITETGAFLGTPAYMAPEQFSGSLTDARSDQFSFSIVAYEALFGSHPFSGKDGKLSVAALCNATIEVKGPRRDPGYVRVLSRGLSRDPADRYPSLQHLLDDLVNVPRRRLRRAVAIATVVCAAAACFGGRAIQVHRAHRCEAAAEQALAGIWDAPRRGKLENVLAGDGKAFGRDVWERVAAALDGYGAQWKRTSTELCGRAGWWWSDGDAMHARSSMCLDERRRQLRAVTDVLTNGDQNVRLRAPDVLVQLDALSACTNPAVLASTSVPAHHPGSSRNVDRIRDLLAQSQALDEALQASPAKEAARRALELAREEHDRALAAEALYRLSVVQETDDEYDAAESSVVQALAEAESSGHERLLPRIWLQMLTIVGHEKDRYSEVERLVPFIETHVQRFDPQGPTHVELLFVLGVIEADRGNYERAIEQLRMVLDMTRTVFAENDLRRIQIYQHLIDVERAVSQFDKAIAHARLALAETEALFGKEHPRLAGTLSLLARMLTEQGDLAGARAAREHASRMVEQVFPSENTYLSKSLFDLGYAYLEAAEPEAALSLFRRAHTITVAESWNGASELAAMARAEMELGHLETARAMCEQALAIFTNVVGASHPESLKVGARLGKILRALRRERDALQLCTQLLRTAEQAPGPHAMVGWVLLCIGESYEQLGQLPEALAALERAEKLLEETTTMLPFGRGPEIRFALARVLWRVGGDRERARRLANEALDSYQYEPPLYAKDGIAIRTWLSKLSEPHRQIRGR